MFFPNQNWTFSVFKLHCYVVPSVENIISLIKGKNGLIGNLAKHLSTWKTKVIWILLFLISYAKAAMSILLNFFATKTWKEWNLLKKLLRVNEMNMMFAFTRKFCKYNIWKIVWSKSLSIANFRVNPLCF